MSRLNYSPAPLGTPPRVRAQVSVGIKRYKRVIVLWVEEFIELFSPGREREMADNEKRDLGSTDTGIQPNIAGLLCYLLGFVTGLIFILIEKKNRFVRFHAMQSIAVFGVFFVAQWVIGIIPVLGVAVNALLMLVSVVICVVLMVKAYQGEMFKIPVAGDFAEKNTA